MKYLIAAVAVLMGVSACAGTEALGTIVVERAWARASPKGAVNGICYLTVVNNGPESDRLIGASSPVADNIQFHEMKMEDGISKMRQLDTIEVPSGTSLKLKPDGIHLMMRIKQQLQQRKTFPLTLNFQKAGKLDVTVNIGSVGAMDDMSGK